VQKRSRGGKLAPQLKTALELPAPAPSSPLAQLTGHLAKVSVVAGASSFVSPCIRASALSGAITDIGDFSAFTPTSAAAQATQAVLGGQWSDATFGGKKVLLAEDTEKTALGVGEYAVYVAALFNDEARAAAAFADIAARSACTAAAAAAALAPARPGATPPAARGRTFLRSVCTLASAPPSDILSAECGRASPGAILSLRVTSA
jgi:hypothetical protein